MAIDTSDAPDPEPTVAPPRAAGAGAAAEGDEDAEAGSGADDKDRPPPGVQRRPPTAEEIKAARKLRRKEKDRKRKVRSAAACLPVFMQQNVFMQQLLPKVIRVGLMAGLCENQVASVALRDCRQVA